MCYNVYMNNLFNTTEGEEEAPEDDVVENAEHGHGDESEAETCEFC